MFLSRFTNVSSPVMCWIHVYVYFQTQFLIKILSYNILVLTLQALQCQSVDNPGYKALFKTVEKEIQNTVLSKTDEKTDLVF